MQYQDLSERDDQTMATIARISRYKLEFAEKLTQSSHFDNTFFKQQCLDVFNALKVAKLESSTLKKFFTETNQKTFDGNIFYGWLRSYAFIKT